MSKTYLAPSLEEFHIEPSAIICESNFGNGTEDFTIVDDFTPIWD